ncbi:hypothetical protein M9Y10_034750 [Tritrichomonas musculus]|uniref:G domain-containing protein n=1 Tax=Tritrichomonas musculus TaxID=1915356 RepID=A0ABR2KGN4_9EUKA
MIPKIKKKGKKKLNKKNDTGKISTAPIGTPDFLAYRKLTQLSQTSTHIFVVLDARNPSSCRFSFYEEKNLQKLIFIINKIDLVPREIAVSWYNELNSRAPTFAVCADKSIQPIVNFIKKKASESTPLRVLITGVGKTGKSVITSKLLKENIPNVDIQKSGSWTWLDPTSDLISIGASELLQSTPNLISFAQDFLCRCSIHSLMDVFKVRFFSDVNFILSTIYTSRKVAAYELLSGLAQKKYPYYTLPHASFIQNNLDNIEETQRETFKLSKINDLFINPFIILSYETPNTLKASVVSLCNKSFDSLMEGKK